MKVIAPVTVTPAMLTSSSIAETEYSTYSSGTTYAAAARVIYQRRGDESLQASNLNKTPGATASAAWWLDVGPTNRWAMFDAIVGTKSTATSSIAVTITPGTIINAVAFVSAVGSAIRVRMLDGVTVVYDQTKNLDSTPIDDWDDYFFAAQVLTGELVFTGLPRYLSATVEATITGIGTVSVGVMAIGVSHELGGVLRGASAGITDYSRKETDATFGTTSLVQRDFAGKADVTILVPTNDTRRLKYLLASLRAIPCVWVGDDDTDTYAPLVIFGWYGDFRIVYDFARYANFSLELKGLT